MLYLKKNDLFLFSDKMDVPVSDNSFESSPTGPRRSRFIARNPCLSFYFDDLGWRRQGKNNKWTRFTQCVICKREFARPEGSSSGMRNHLK